MASKTYSQRGVGSVLVSIIALILVVVLLVGAWGLSWLTSITAAQNAADLAALSAAQAHFLGQDGCNKADAVANQNHVEITDCRLSQSGSQFILKVCLSAPLSPQLVRGPKRVARCAKAGILA